MISKSSDKLYIQYNDMKHTVIPNGADVKTTRMSDIKYLSIITDFIKRKYVQITRIILEYLEWNCNISWMKLITILRISLKKSLIVWQTKFHIPGSV